jgi:glycosyltransferase involved in cell wall biosynthesis
VQVMLLTQYYPPELGAAQTRLSELAAHFLQRGHSVTVLTSMPSYPLGAIYPGYGGLLRREVVGGVNVIRTFIYPTKKVRFVPRLANYFSFVLSSAVVGSFLLNSVDFLIVESPPLFLALSGFWLSRLKGARLIFNVADLWPQSAVQLGLLRSRFALYLSRLLEAFSYRKAWLITGQSKGIIASISERFPQCPIFYLPNGVNPQRFQPSRCAGKTWSDCRENCVVLYAGLHGLAQGLDQVLEAAEILNAESSIQFVLIGDGPEKQRLVKQAQLRFLPNVRFLDPLPAEEIPPLLAAADVVLVTLKTRIDGAVPFKLYEAMAAGRAVVLVAAGEAADIIRKHQAGIVVEPGDVRGLTNALKTLHAQPDLCRVLGSNGRQAAEQHFDWTKTASRFVEYLEAHQGVPSTSNRKPPLRRPLQGNGPNRP